MLKSAAFGKIKLDSLRFPESLAGQYRLLFLTLTARPLPSNSASHSYRSYYRLKVALIAQRVMCFNNCDTTCVQISWESR